MKAQFFDRQNAANPLNGASIENLLDLQNVLDSSRGRSPYMAELIGDNGYKLLLGLGGTEGCVQFSPADGTPPYLMATATNAQDAEGDLDFLIGDAASSVPRRYCLPSQVVEDIAAEFVQTGQRKSDVHWEEI